MAKVSLPSKCKYCGWSYPMTKPGTEDLDWFCSKRCDKGGEALPVEGNKKPPKECPLRQKPGWKV